MLETVVVGYGLAGKSFHIPLIRREVRLRLAAIATRDPSRRAQAESEQGVPSYPSLEAALASSTRIDLVVIATPHDSHESLSISALEAGKHCVTDKVMCLTSAAADRMIEARDRSGRMLSVFQNRRWDWDYLTLRSVLESGRIGAPLLIESAVCRYAPPRTWRGKAAEAGTILHDWGAHLVDQALQMGFGPCRKLRCWLSPAPWPGVDTGGHGRIALEFDQLQFTIETSRICALDRPRWWVVASDGGFERLGVDPQEEALRAGDIGTAADRPGHGSFVSKIHEGTTVKEEIAGVQGSWDSYYTNIADHLLAGAPLSVTAEQAREVVRVLAAASGSAENGESVAGPWGFPA